MAKNLKVGDLCITVNTNMPAVNDGILVEIIGFNPTMKSSKGELVPYLIRRLDGSPFISTLHPTSGELRWCKAGDAWAAGYKLKRIEGRKTYKTTDELVEAEV